MAEKIKKQIKEAEKKEEQFINFLIRDFYEIKILLKLIMEAEKLKAGGKTEELKLCIKKILGKLRGGIFGSEERIEYRMARCFNKMEHLVESIEPLIAKVFPGEVKEINSLLEQGKIYNADLEKLGSRSGEIESELRGAEKNSAKLDRAFELIKKSLQDVQAFESVISQLLDKTKSIISKIDRIGSLDPEREHLGKLNIGIIDFEARAIFKPNESEYAITFNVDGMMNRNEFRLNLKDNYVRIDPNVFYFDSVQNLFEFLISGHEINITIRDRESGKSKSLYFEENDKIARLIFYVLQSTQKSKLDEFFETCETIQSRLRKGRR